MPDTTRETQDLIVISTLEGNAPTQLYGVQPYVMEYAHELITLWWVVFWLTVLVVIWIGYQHREKSNGDII